MRAKVRGARRAWPLRLAAREGAAAARTGRWTSLLVIAAVAWIIAAPAAADARSVSRLVVQEQEWLKSGGHVFAVYGASKADSGPSSISVAACEKLKELDGVKASFALKTGQLTAGFAHTPGQPMGLSLASAGVMRFLGVTTDARGVVIIATDVATQAGISDGAPVRITRPELVESPAFAIYQVYGGGVVVGGPWDGGDQAPPGPRAGNLPASEVLTARVTNTTALAGSLGSSGLIIPAPLTGDADTCYVRTDAAHDSAIRAELAALLAFDGRPAAPQEASYTGEFTVDFGHAYQERILRWAWVAGAAVLGLLWALLQWFKRSHMAIYATFGMRAAPRLVLQASEWGVLAGVGLLWGWGLGIVGALAFGARVEQALLQVSLHAALTVLGASVLVVLVGLRPTGTLLNALKER